MKEEKKSILYYPNIKIEDGYWLRNAILYWDEVASIVPGTNYDEVNSIEVEALRSAGIYKPVYPVELHNDEELCMRFCEEVSKNLRYRRKRRHAGGGEFSQNEYSRVHVEKMSMDMGSMVHIDKAPGTVLDMLIDEGVALRNCDGPWINMRTQDAEVYMSVLAKYLAATHNDMDIGTDKINKFFYPYRGNLSKATDNKQAYLDIALQEILPMPAMDIPLYDIIEFKNEHVKQLKCFRQRIEDFQWKLKHCTSRDEVYELTARFQSEIADEVDEIDELICTRDMRTFKKTLRTLIPLAVTTGAELLALKGEISQESAIGIGAVANLMTLFGRENEEKYNEKNSFLFAARDNGIITRYHRRIL